MKSRFFTLTHQKKAQFSHSTSRMSSCRCISMRQCCQLTHRPGTFPQHRSLCISMRQCCQLTRRPGTFPQRSLCISNRLRCPLMRRPGTFPQRSLYIVTLPFCRLSCYTFPRRNVYRPSLMHPTTSPRGSPKLAQGRRLLCSRRSQGSNRGATIRCLVSRRTWTTRRG